MIANGPNGNIYDPNSPKNALVAADMLNDKVVPFFEQHDLKLMRMLTDRGTAYCGNRENHEYELYLGRGGYRPF